MQQPNYVTVGEDYITGEEIRLRDIDRQSGLYILGTTGTGKTTLLSNLIDQDLARGHGLFFLDPPGDAVKHILENGRHTERLERDLILLDPTVKDRSFGINLLACREPRNLNARLSAYNRAYRVFERLFGNEWGQYGTWGPWLQEMLQYTLYAFIENQAYTLAEVPLFITDTAFRDHVVRNIRYDRRVAHYWLHEFGALPTTMQLDRMQAFHTRMNILLHTPVFHILGQTSNTIAFEECMRRKAIILVTLPLSVLSKDLKDTIGKLLLSELLHAVHSREYLPSSQRQLFSIYVDEVQDFANSNDFSTLFTQARKYAIATTVAHQERFGQLADNKKMAGATLQAANLICFRLSRHDDDELAPVFAEAPPTEMRREQELVISQNPFTDLLRGHTNPEINAFAQTYLRRIIEEREDLREDMEAERFIRQDILDEASLERLEAQMFGHGSLSAIESTYQALARAEHAISRARGQTAQMVALHERVRSFRQLIRTFNTFFTAVMEGRLAPGSDEFSTFLIDRLRTGSHVPERYRPIFSLYLSLRYGDPTAPRALPFEIAKAYGIFPDTVTALVVAHDHQTAQARDAFRKLFHDDKRWRIFLHKPPEPADMISFKRSLIPDASFGDRQYPEAHCKSIWPPRPPYERIWLLPDTYTLYVFFIATPGLEQLLSPYRQARFASSSKGFACDINQFVTYIWGYYDGRDKEAQRFSTSMGTYRLMDRRVTRKLTTFLATYREGGLVILSLVAMARRYWPDKRHYPFYINGCNIYHRLSMLDFLWIRDSDPIDLLKTVRAANELIRSRPRPDPKRYFTNRLHNFFERMRYSIYPDAEEIEKAGYAFSCPPFPEISVDSRKVVQSLHVTLTEQWQTFSREYPSAASSWASYDAVTQWYFLNRACDLVYLGRTIADNTFPSPIQETQQATIEALSRFLQDVLKKQLVEHNARAVEKHETAVRGEKEEINRECTRELEKIMPPLPNQLPARVLDDQERSQVLEMCHQELRKGLEVRWDADASLAMIEKFVGLCRMLRQPENRVLVPTGQYIEKQVPTRTERDMADEMARKLRDLDPYTAYVRVLVERDSRSQVIKRLIKPPAPLPVPQEQPTPAPLRLAPGVYKDRARIDEEIRLRQARWRGTRQPRGHSKKPPPTSH